MGQESVYVRNKDEPYWLKLEKIAFKKNVPVSQEVINAIKFYLKEGEHSEV